LQIFPEEKDLFDFKEKFADELRRDDVIFIENPNNKTDLENQLEPHWRKFDRVVVSAHGGQGEIPTMTVGEDKVTITDVIKAVNKDKEGALKKIHLTSCFIGSNFDRIEKKDNLSNYYSELNGSLRDGQILVLHGDSYTGDITTSLDQRLKEIVKSVNYSISEAVFDSAEAMSVVFKKHSNQTESASLETFSYEPFAREDKEFSTTGLIPYFNKTVTKARNFENDQGILNGDVSKLRLENLTKEDSEQYLSEYLSESFVKEATKLIDGNFTKEFKSLLEKTDPNLANKDGFTALMYAADKGDAEMVEYLIEKGADPEIKTPLGFAASNFSRGGNKDKIIELISQAIEKKNKDATLREWKSAFSSEDLKKMQGESINSISNFLGQNIWEGSLEIDSKAIWDGNEKVFDVKKIQQIDSVNFSLEGWGQNYSAINPTLLRGGEVHVPSTTIENGTAVLFGVAWAEIAKYVNGRFTPTTNPKPKNGEKVEEEDLYKKP
jgi:hypothetical protein